MSNNKLNLQEIMQPIDNSNSFLNPKDDFLTLKKGVVLHNQTYEYEVVDSYDCNFTIIKPAEESKENELFFLIK